MAAQNDYEALPDDLLTDILLYINKSITSDTDREEIKFYLSGNLQRKDFMDMGLLRVFLILQFERMITLNDFSLLHSCLRKVCRYDLIDYLEKVCHGSTSGGTNDYAPSSNYQTHFYNQYFMRGSWNRMTHPESALRNKSVGRRPNKPIQSDDRVHIQSNVNEQKEYHPPIAEIQPECDSIAQHTILNTPRQESPGHAYDRRLPGYASPIVCCTDRNVLDETELKTAQLSLRTHQLMSRMRSPGPTRRLTPSVDHSHQITTVRSPEPTRRLIHNVDHSHQITRMRSPEPTRRVAPDVDHSNPVTSARGPEPAGIMVPNVDHSHDLPLLQNLNQNYENTVIQHSDGTRNQYFVRGKWEHRSLPVHILQSRNKSNLSNVVVSSPDKRGYIHQQNTHRYYQACPFPQSILHDPNAGQSEGLLQGHPTGQSAGILQNLHAGLSGGLLQGYPTGQSAVILQNHLTDQTVGLLQDHHAGEPGGVLQGHQTGQPTIQQPMLFVGQRMNPSSFSTQPCINAADKMYHYPEISIIANPGMSHSISDQMINPTDRLLRAATSPPVTGAIGQCQTNHCPSSNTPPPMDITTGVEHLDDLEGKDSDAADTTMADSTSSTTPPAWNNNMIYEEIGDTCEKATGKKTGIKRLPNLLRRPFKKKPKI